MSEILSRAALDELMESTRSDNASEMREARTLIRNSHEEMRRRIDCTLVMLRGFYDPKPSCSITGVVEVLEGRTKPDQIVPLCRRCGLPDEPGHQFGFRDHAFRHPNDCLTCDGQGLVYSRKSHTSRTCRACNGVGKKSPNVWRNDKRAARGAGYGVRERVVERRSNMAYVCASPRR